MSMQEEKQPREELKKDLKTKEIYHFIDEKQGINIKSSEIFKNEKKIVHYPFNKRDGSQKYNSVKKITYLDVSTLPRGFLKYWSTGYGFTKIYNPLLYVLQEKYDIGEVIIGKKLKNEVADQILKFNYKTLDNIYPQIDSLFDEQKQDKNLLVNNILSSIFPRKFKKKQIRYVSGSLDRFIKYRIQTGNNDLSNNDIKSIFDLISQFNLEGYYLKDKQKVLTTKYEIEKIYIDEVLNKFEKLFRQKTDTDKLEERWQLFFKEYNWIFSQLFSSPVLIYKDKAYAGGKNIENKKGKVADFIYKNELTQNIAFIEIKTHRKNILKKKPYRGDDVFAAGDDLSGGINQVLNQRDNLQKDFWNIRGRSKEDFESLNSKCFLVIGLVSEFSEEQEKAFELIRSNSKDVEIVTFDEVFHKIKGLSKIISGNVNKK